MSRFSRKCRHASCANATKHPSGYCEAHASKRTAPPSLSRKAAQAFYRTPAWRRLSKQVRDANPLCEECQRQPSAHADHIVPIEKGGAPLDPENVQALCKKCHSRKTATFDGGFGNRRR